jgi:alpha-galactosidase
MPTVGGTHPVRCGAWLLAGLLGIFGCGDRHLTAILPPRTDPGSGGGSAGGPPAAPASCGLGEGQGAGPLPPMGWNGWNAFGCGPELDQAKFMANADALLARGLADVGYEYMNLDDCWQSGRGADGVVTVNAARFPDGIGALGDYVHARGLKLGIDSCSAGCQRPELITPGTVGYETQDAQSYALWGVDFVKYTGSGSNQARLRADFETMRDALEQTGRPMLLSIVNAPFKYWHTELGQMWRTHDDIEPTWSDVLDVIDVTSKLAAYAGQGGYNDADMLWIGNPGLSESESRAVFSVWAILASPLLAGNDLTEMSAATQAILTNREVIALNQDALRLQGAFLGTQDDVSVYAKPLAACGGRGVVLLNRGSSPSEASVTWQALGLAPGSATVRDLWAGIDLAPAEDAVSVTVPPHDAVALRIVGSEPELPRGTQFLSDLPWSYAVNGWGPVERDQELGGEAAEDGAALTLGGVSYEKGLGTNSPSLVRYRLGGACSQFDAIIGIDDLTGDNGSAVFQVWADGEKLFDSGVLTGSSPPRTVSVDISGRHEMRLVVGEVEDFALDHGNWVNARVVCSE